MKVILVWSTAFGHVANFGGNESNCVVTYDRAAIDRADAVVFHFHETRDNVARLPLDRRKPWQRYVIVRQ